MNTRISYGLKLLVIAFLLQVNSLQAADFTSPMQLVKHIQKNIYSRMSLDSQLIKTNPNHIKTIAKEELIPFFDYKFAAMFTLYKAKIKASSDEKKAFIEAYKNYLVTDYAQLYAVSIGERIVYGQPKVNGKFTIIPTTLMPEKAYVGFKLRKNKKTGSWGLTDKAVSIQSKSWDMYDSSQKKLVDLLRGKSITHALDILLEKTHKSIKLR
jgi:phospholipid transport system substrate-binding protein